MTIALRAPHKDLECEATNIAQSIVEMYPHEFQFCEDVIFERKKTGLPLRLKTLSNLKDQYDMILEIHKGSIYANQAKLGLTLHPKFWRVVRKLIPIHKNFIYREIGLDIELPIPSFEVYFPAGKDRELMEEPLYRVDRQIRQNVIEKAAKVISIEGRILLDCSQILAQIPSSYGRIQKFFYKLFSLYANYQIQGWLNPERFFGGILKTNNK